MRLYLAPLEGITGWIFRSAVHECFGGFDKYFVPFIRPNQMGHFSAREKKDILPEHNEGMYTVPQILTNRPEDFIRTAYKLSEYGYQEINLNLGCPSRTVVTKGRGAGFLADPDRLDAFLYEVFEKCGIRISVKTRLGMDDPEELCYNGDIFTVEDYIRFTQIHPEVECVMTGRGVLADPALARKIRGGAGADAGELRRFHDLLYAGYCREMSGDRTILFKMKELWTYLAPVFTNYKKYVKKIKKAEKCAVYEKIIEELFANEEISVS